MARNDFRKGAAAGIRPAGVRTVHAAIRRRACAARAVDCGSSVLHRPRAMQGAFDESDKHYKVLRMDLLRGVSTRLAFIRNLLPTRGEVWYRWQLLKHLPARSVKELKVVRYPVDPEPTQLPTFIEACKAHNLVFDDNKARLALLQCKHLGATPQHL